MSRITDVKIRLDKVWDQIEVDEDILGRLEKVVEDAYVSRTNSLVNKLNSDAWPRAADPLLICDPSSETDKKVRASAIYNLVVAHRLGGDPVGKRLLDFGCGDGHLARCAYEGGVELSVGYDVQKPDGWQDENKFALTADFEYVKLMGPYNLIVMYDVLDHVMDGHPADVLGQAKSVLAPGGSIYVRLHPWCSRHGTHLWKLNKAFAHVVFTESELEGMGHRGVPTRVITDPKPEYQRWFTTARLRVTWNDTVCEQVDPFFESNRPIKERMLTRLGRNEIAYPVIEQTFYDYVLEV